MEFQSASGRSLLGFVVSVLVLMPSPARAEPEAGEAHVDLARYFPTGQAEVEDRVALRKKVSDFVAGSRANHPSALELEARMKSAEPLLLALHRHAVYLKLLYAVHHGDSTSLVAGAEVSSEAAEVENAVRAELRELKPGTFSRWSQARPALKRFAYVADEAVREAGHALPPSEAKLVDQLAAPSLDAFGDLYGKTVRSTAFAKLTTPQGLQDVRSDYDQLLASPDRALRSAAFHGLLQGFASHEQVYAALLFNIVRERSALSKLARYPDAPTESYDSKKLTRAGVAGCLDAVAGQQGVLKEFRALQASRVRAATGLPDIHAWDVNATLPAASLPRFSLAEGRAVMLAALAPLGPDYVRHFQDLLDPAQGRADIGPAAAERQGGGFSAGYPGLTSALFVGDYRGSLKNLTTVIHEGGHAVHRQLMTEAGVSPFHASGASWMNEAFAILNGFLLQKELVRSTRDPRLKLFYQESLVNEMTFQVFTSAAETALEQALFDSVSSGKITTGQDLDALTLKVLVEYDAQDPSEIDMGHTWMRKSLLFEDPLYYVNYLYAGLLATQLLNLVEKDPAGFQIQYGALLKRGFDAPPEALLRSTLGMGVPGAGEVTGATSVIRSEIETLRQLDAAANPPRKSSGTK